MQPCVALKELYSRNYFKDLISISLFLQTNIFYCVCYDWWWWLTDKRFVHVFSSKCWIIIWISKQYRLYCKVMNSSITSCSLIVAPTTWPTLPVWWWDSKHTTYSCYIKWRKCAHMGLNGFHIKWIVGIYPLQLKKSKSREPFWSYQLNSTADLADLANLANLAQFWGKWAGLAVLFSW